ncbi:TlpA family protein disulfide reductase [Saprospiraceae bacterium]|nr:TlpA family protein disulfide reductase [Saprospiraceae bacterium]
MRRLLICFLPTVLFLSSCITVNNTYPKLPPGQWRGILKLTDPEAVNVPSTIFEGDAKVLDYFELPFNMEVSYEGEEMKVFIVNGEEKIPIKNIHFERDRSSAKDTLLLGFPEYDTRINAFYEDNFIEGNWYVDYKDGYSIPVLIQYGQFHRFIDHPVGNTYDFSGQWDVTFEFDNPKDAYPAIGEFKQDGNNLSGTFLTETGDYRYLDGNAYGDKLRLSVFDGSHAFLFSGSVSNDTIYGEFRSGKHYKSNWIATKSNEANYLKDPYQMTKMNEGAQANFSLKNTNSEIVSFSDESYNDKVKIINIMGTWCPNCKDEIQYLKEIKKNYPEVEIVSIAYERYRDEDKVLGLLRDYKSVMDIDWPLLHGGYADKKETAQALGFVDKIYSYPTMILINKDNGVEDIHTGFNGPATSKYKTFDKEFRKKIEVLLK